MPRNIGMNEAEHLRQPLRHRPPLGPERSQRSSRAAKLKHPATLPDLEQTRAVTRHRIQPACGFPSERDRNSLLQPGASHHDRALVPLDQYCQLTAEPTYRGIDQIERLDRLQNESAIDHILAGRTPVNVLRRLGILPPHGLGKLLDQRQGQGPRLRGTRPKGLQVERLDPACGRDRPRCALRNQPAGRLRRGQRRLEIEHAPQTIFIAEDREHRAGIKKIVK